MTGTVSGFIVGESQVTATTGTPSFTTTATASSPTGSYAINGGGLSANNGNYTFAQDPANATALTIAAAASTTTLSAPATAVYGQNVTFTAAVALPGSTGTAAGTVTFTENGNPLPGGCANAVTVASGTASCTTSALTVSAHSVIATFTPGDGNTSSSTGGANIEVSAAATMTTIANAQPWTVSLGAATTVSVTVAATAPGSGTPSGAVAVSDGSGAQCTIAALSNGFGSCTLTPTSAGTKTITATYAPDVASSANFLGSSSSATLNVTPSQPGSTLISSANPSVYGQAVTLTATVTPVSGGVMPSGAVQFFIDGNTEICAGTSLTATGSANSVSAVCAVPQDDLSVGDHPLRFQYAGDANNLPSSATLLDNANNTIPQTVTAAQTTTTITAPASIVLGSTVTVGVNVIANAPGAGIPTGEVAVSLAGSNCSVTLDASGAGTCTFTPPPPAGNQTITAEYAGTTNFAASSAGASLQVAMATTSTALASPAPITLGSSVSMTATVAVNAPGAGTPTGSVTISDGGSASGDHCTFVLPATNCALTPSSAGSKTVTAVYTPDAAASVNFGGSSAKPVLLMVNPAASGTSLASSINPSAFGQGITFTATVTPAAGGVVPTGSVAFADGATPLCSAVDLIAGANNATAVCTTSALNVGTHAITAQYSGDANNQASTADLSQIVNKADQTLIFPAQTPPSRTFVVNGTFAVAPLATSTTPNSGQPIVYSTKSANICVINGTTVTMLAVGTCTLAANQAGDGSYNAAAEVTQNIGIGIAASTVTLAASTTTPIVGATVVLTVTVTGQAPTGTVSITDGGTALCSQVALTTAGNTATATCETSFATSGSRTLSAAYSGDANNAAQNAAPLQIDVGLKCSATSLTATPDHIRAGQSLTVAATVSGCSTPTATSNPAPSGNTSNIFAADAPPASLPTGVVTFYDNTVVLGPVALDGTGVATLPLSTLSAGTHTLQARYAGDDIYAPSQAQLAVVVDSPAAPPVPAPALHRWTLWLLAAMLGLAGAAARSRRKRNGIF